MADQHLNRFDIVPARDITQALGGRWYGGYGTAHCPVNEDRNASRATAPSTPTRRSVPYRKDSDMNLFETCSKPNPIAYEVCDSQTGKRWSGPFSTMETADEIIRNLAPLYPGRKFGVNTVRVQRL